MKHFSVGDRVQWTKNFAMAANVRKGDTGTVTFAASGNNICRVAPDINRGGIPRGCGPGTGFFAYEGDLAPIEAFIRADGEIVCPDCHMASSQHHQKCGVAAIECPCGIHRTQCDYHREG